MNPKETLQKLGLSRAEVEVYHTMLSGKLQVKDIVNVTGMKRPSVYYALSRLEQRGLIGRVQSGEYNQWQLGDAAVLERLVEERSVEVIKLQKEVVALTEQIENGPSSKLTSQVTFYEGQKAVEGVVFNMLYCKNKEILSIAPDNNFFHQTGQEFALKFIAERKKRQIVTKHLWETTGPATKETLDEFYPAPAEVRVMPKSMHGKFVTAMFIYDDTVLYVSSQVSGYAVVFRSKEQAELQRAMCEVVWEQSKKLEIQ